MTNDIIGPIVESVVEKLFDELGRAKFTSDEMPQSAMVLSDIYESSWKGVARTELNAALQAVRKMGREEEEELYKKLWLVLPMAKAWAAIHNVGGNAEFVRQAQETVDAYERRVAAARLGEQGEGTV